MYSEELEFLDIKQLKTYFDNDKYFFVVDSNVWSLYATSLNFIDKNRLYIFEADEHKKTLDEATKIWEFLLRIGFDRTGTIVVIGGGVSIDLVSFVASTYKRGVNLVKVPTTLLAMIDAAIGGKTALNYNGYKNILGTFYFGKILVVIDFLSTLNEIEYYNGVGELLKYGLIGQNEIKKLMFNRLNSLKDRDRDFLVTLVELSINFKQAIVKKDPYDLDNIRAILNFGHTLGHVIESLSDYKIKHGYAVVKGMNFSMILSEKLGYFSHRNDVLKIFDKLNYDLSFNFSVKDVLSVLRKDKKVRQDIVNFVLIDDSYSAFIKPIKLEDLRTYLSDMC